MGPGGAARARRGAVGRGAALLCGAVAWVGHAGLLRPCAALGAAAAPAAPRRQLLRQLAPAVLGTAAGPAVRLAPARAEALPQLPNEFYQETTKVARKTKQALFDLTGAAGKKNKARFGDGQLQALKFIEKYTDKYLTPPYGGMDTGHPAYVQMKATLERVASEGFPDSSNTKYLYSLVGDFEKVIKLCDKSGVDPKTIVEADLEELGGLSRK